jgi:hypothetical protein
MLSNDCFSIKSVDSGQQLMPETLRSAHDRVDLLSNLLFPFRYASLFVFEGIDWTLFNLN